MTTGTFYAPPSEFVSGPKAQSKDGWNELHRPFCNQNPLGLCPLANTGWPVFQHTTNLGPEAAHNPFAWGLKRFFTCINGTHNDSDSLPGNNGFSAIPPGVTINVSVV